MKASKFNFLVKHLNDFFFLTFRRRNFKPTAYHRLKIQFFLKIQNPQVAASALHSSKLLVINQKQVPILSATPSPQCLPSEYIKDAKYIHPSLTSCNSN